MEEGRPVGISALAGLLYAAAAAGLTLFVLLLVSGQDHPAFQAVDPELRRLLFVGLPLGSALAAVLGSGLIGLRCWAWWSSAALTATLLAITLAALVWKYRVWQAAPSAVAARDEFLAQGCWAFLVLVLVLYLLTATVLDAFAMRRRLLCRATILVYLVFAAASGYGFAEEVRRLALAALRWIARGSVP